MADRLTELTEADRARIEAVLEAHSGYIESVAVRFAPNPDLVPDVVQQVAVKLCQSFHSFRGEANIRTWLFSVTRNEAVTIYRKEHRVDVTREALETYTVEEVVDVEQDLVDADARARQRTLFSRGYKEALSPRQREAVRNMIRPEGVTVSRDRSSLTRARQRLRAWVARETETND